MTDPQTREAVLQRLLTGDLGVESAEAQALFAADPSARRRFEELRDVATLLDGAASEETETLAEARGIQDAPGAARADATLEQLRAGATQSAAPDPAPVATLSRWWPLALAAAASLIVWLGVRSSEDAPHGPPDDFVLGSDQLELLAPVGEVESYGTFSWRADVPGGTFVLRIWDASSDDLRVVYEKKQLAGTSWTLDKDLIGTLPGSIRWEILPFGPAGEPLEPGVAYASLPDS